MRATLTSLKQTGSSSRWLARQAKDPFVRSRTGSSGESYRSRSSFKLVSICEKYPSLLSPGRHGQGKVIVDLGAAPGGWSQVARQKMGKHDRIFAVDILDMHPVPGVEIMKGDFLQSTVQDNLRRRILGSHDTQYQTLGPKVTDDRLVDIVLSDMMGPMTGSRLTDVRMSLDLVEAAAVFAFANLKTSANQSSSPLPGGAGQTQGGHMV